MTLFSGLAGTSLGFKVVCLQKRSVTLLHFPPMPQRPFASAKNISELPADALGIPAVPHLGHQLMGAISYDKIKFMNTFALVSPSWSVDYKEYPLSFASLTCLGMVGPKLKMNWANGEGDKTNSCRVHFLQKIQTLGRLMRWFNQIWFCKWRRASIEEWTWGHCTKFSSEQATFVKSLFKDPTIPNLVFICLYFWGKSPNNLFSYIPWNTLFP